MNSKAFLAIKNGVYQLDILYPDNEISMRFYFPKLTLDSSVKEAIMCDEERIETVEKELGCIMDWIKTQGYYFCEECNKFGITPVEERIIPFKYVKKALCQNCINIFFG